MLDSPQYNSILSSIVDYPLPSEVLKILGKAEESQDFEPNKQLNMELVVDADFIRYFLSYIRNSFSSVIKTSHCTHPLKSPSKEDGADGVIFKSCDHEDRGSYKRNLMSSPKVRGPTATSFANRSHAHVTDGLKDASIVYHHATQNREAVKPNKFGIDGKHAHCETEKNKHKMKSLSLHDFIPNNAKPNRKSAPKDFLTKPCSEKAKLNEAKNNALLSRLESRFTNPEILSGFGCRKESSLPSRSKASISSETSKNISFDFENKSDFPDLSMERPITRSSKPTRRIKPTAVGVQKTISIDGSINSSQQNMITANEHNVESNEVVSDVSKSQKLQQVGRHCIKVKIPLWNREFILTCRKYSVQFIQY